LKHYHVVKLDEFPEGSRRVVSCDGVEIGVFNVDGEIVAWYNNCVHMRGPVCQGRIYKRVLEPVEADGTTRMMTYSEEHTHIVCPWHGYEYDMRTGCHVADKRIRLRKYQVVEKGGDVYVVA